MGVGRHPGGLVSQNVHRKCFYMICLYIDIYIYICIHASVAGAAGGLRETCAASAPGASGEGGELRGERTGSGRGADGDCARRARRVEAMSRDVQSAQFKKAFLLHAALKLQCACWLLIQS